MSDSEIINELLSSNDVLRIQVETFKQEVENTKKQMKLLQD